MPGSPSLPENPKREDLIQVFAGLLDGRYSRKEVDRWWAASQQVKLTSDEGGWEFATLGYIASRDETGEPMLRAGDLAEMLAGLRREPGETVGAFTRLRPQDMPFYQGSLREFAVEDSEREIEARLPLAVARMVVDGLCDLRETLWFRFHGQAFGVDRHLEHPEGLQFYYDPSWKKGDLFPLAALVSFLGLSRDDIHSDDRRPTILDRQDDNGNVFEIGRYELFEALCERAELEARGHRQLYSVRLVKGR